MANANACRCMTGTSSDMYDKRVGQPIKAT